MSDYGDDFDASDDDWAYLDAEDVYDEIDDLIEHTCPSPAYESNHTGPNEYDTYDYFNVDLEYLSDSYFDDCIQHDLGMKRRNTKSVRHMQSPKRRGGRPFAHGPVLWRSQIAHRESPTVQSPPDCKSFALLQDWRERFHEVTPVILNSSASIPHGADVEAFDVHNLHSFAKLLVGDSLEALTADLVAKGLDPEAVQVVLDDLISGRDPVFDTDHDEGERKDGLEATSDDAGPQSEDGEDLRLSRDSVKFTGTGDVAHQHLTRQQTQLVTTTYEDNQVPSSEQEKVRGPSSKRKRDSLPDASSLTNKRKTKSHSGDSPTVNASRAILKRAGRK